MPEGDFLLLVDASSYFHRAYHASAKTIRRRDGQHTGAIITFCWSMMKIFRMNRTAMGRRPTHAAIIMDSRGKNFRHEIYPDYKANRNAYEDELEAQLPFIPAIAEAFNIPCIMMPGWEADDVIATYADIAPREGMNVVIASSDKDLMQLVGPKVFMYDAMKDRDPERYDTSNAIIDTDAVFEKWGVFPWQMCDMQALMGDAVDNVPGVMGIGPKIAAKLIKQFGSFERVLDAAEWDSEGFTPKMHINIIEAAEAVRVSRQLVELARNVPVEYEIDDLFLKNADIKRLKAFFMDLEAPQLEARVDF
jgi:DNA polymerase-1